MDIAEIFPSIQGESSRMGLPTVFVRCAGCNLDCTYCDTRSARGKGVQHTLDDIIGAVEACGIRRVTVTGGEPLCQEETPVLCRDLLARGYEVQIETNGSLDISVVPGDARVIMDVKTPGSAMDSRNDYTNLARLRNDDEVKFVITSKQDYDWSLHMVRDRAIQDREILFSPARGMLGPQDLAEWLIADRCDNIRFHLPVHSVLWPGMHGR